MSVVEDTRQVLQDFLAPELRAISARLDALEKIVDANEGCAEKRYQEIESRADKRHAEVLSAINQISNYHVVLERLARLEGQVRQ